MTAEQLEKLCEQLATANDFLRDTPPEVLSTRQKDWLTVLSMRCVDFIETDEKICD